MATDYLAINSVDLFITEQCNLSCKYCFATSNTESVLSIEDGRRILDELYKRYPKDMFINFFGGEPLLYPKIVVALMEYAKTLWSRLSFGISTNATVFDEEIFQYFADNKMKLQVSCDGDIQTQNEERGQAELVHENIKKILKLFPKLCVRLTYTPENVDRLIDNVVFIYEKLGVKNIMHQAVIEANWTEQKLSEYQNQLKMMFHYKRYHRNLEIHFIDKNIKLVSNDIHLPPHYCEAGKTMVAILPNGDVYPCHRAASNRIFKLGNIFDGKKIIRGMFLNIDKNSTGCAKNCPASITCHACVIAHYLVNKNIQEPIKQYCKLMMIEYQGAEVFKQTDKDDKTNHLLQSMAKLMIDISGQQEEILGRVKKIEEENYSNSIQQDDGQNSEKESS